MTTKERISSFLTNNMTEATSYDVYTHFSESDSPVSSDTIDRNLKEMTDAGTLVREKKATNGGRQVYHYKLAVSPRKTVSTNATKVEVSETTVSATGNIESASTQNGPRRVYFVRKNDIAQSIWGSRQYVFAEKISPFQVTSRPFMPVGGTVVSIFYTNHALTEIADAISSSMPDVTFQIVPTLDLAMEVIDAWSTDLDSRQVETFKNGSEDYFNRYAPPAPPAPVTRQEALEILAEGNVNKITKSVFDELVRFAQETLSAQANS